MAFTIDGIDRRLDEKLSTLARREGMSKNKLVKRILARAMGTAYSDNKPEEHRVFLDSWNDEDLQGFTSTQLHNSPVDPTDWQ